MTLGRVMLAGVLVVVAGFGGYLLIAPEDHEGRTERRSREVSVIVEAASMREFEDVVEAVGTLNAQDSVMLSPGVADMVEKIHFTDGQVVLKNDLLVELVSDEEEAQLEEARANFKEAEQQFKRISDLASRGSATNADLDAEQRRVNEARSRLIATEARLRDRQVRAPFDGVLGLRQISEGSIIGPDTTITTIDAVRKMNLDFDVPERFLATLKPGLEVDSLAEAFPDRVFRGVVRTVGSRVDPATRLVTVRAELDNSDLLLRPGMLMSLRLIAHRWQAVSVPEEAVVPTGSRDYAFIVKDGAATRAPIEVGIRRPGYVEVTAGLTAGDMVVTEGGFRLSTGTTPVRMKLASDARGSDAARHSAGR